MYDDGGIRLDELVVVWDFGDQSCRDFFMEALLQSIMIATLAKTKRDTFVPDGVQEVSLYNLYDGPAFCPFGNTEIVSCLPLPALRSLSLSA